MTARLHAAFGAPRSVPCEEQKTARERDPSEDVWALVVAQAVMRHVPRLPSLELGTDAAPSDTPAEQTGEATSGEPGSAAANAAADGTGDADPTEASGLPARLTTELLDSRLGRLSLVVARGKKGLSIVINVADSHVKALIIAEQATLMQSLKDCGLLVASVQIGQSAGAGTLLAPDREGADRARSNPSLRQHNKRLRAYQSPLEEEDAETEGVDFTA